MLEKLISITYKEYSYLNIKSEETFEFCSFTSDCVKISKKGLEKVKSNEKEWRELVDTNTGSWQVTPNDQFIASSNASANIKIDGSNLFDSTSENK